MFLHSFARCASAYILFACLFACFQSLITSLSMLKAVEVISFILHPPVVSCVRECCIYKVYANNPRKTGKMINKIKAPDRFPHISRFCHSVSIWKKP